jgi:hypothetical protein
LTDKSISAAGSAGFRTSQDVEVANFIAN